MCCMQALVAMLLPTHFFYAFIYYTDVGSVTFVLASYLVSMTRLIVFLAHPYKRQSRLRIFNKISSRDGVLRRRACVSSIT